MEEVLKWVGGPSGVFSLFAVVAALWWKVRVPQMGVDYLQRELEINRQEVAEADRERKVLRDEIKAERNKVEEFERQFMECLVERERALRRIKLCEKLLRDYGHSLPAREED